MMKSKLIIANFMASWIGLCIDTENSPLWACLLAAVWFCASAYLFTRAARRGDFRKIEKRFKIDEL